MCAITRDYLADPGRRPTGRLGHRGDRSPATRREDDADLARRFRAALTWVRDQAQIVPIPLGTPNTVDEPYPVPSETFGWAAGDAAYAMGSFALEEDEALVIEGRSPPCAFWNVCLWNQFLHTYDYAYEQVTLNGTQVVYEADGSWRVVVARPDPGHPNWISTAGHGGDGSGSAGSSPSHPGAARHPGGPHRCGRTGRRVTGSGLRSAVTAGRRRSSSTTSPTPASAPRSNSSGTHGRVAPGCPLEPDALCRPPSSRPGRRLRRRRLPCPPRGALPGAHR